ncbi:TPA: hypothetical protein ACJG8U_004723, partial [Salmonella enterica subsp. enterica serovar Warragul]
MRLSDSPTTTLLLCEVLSASGSSNNRRKATVFCRDADLLHNRKEHLRATGSLPNPPGKLLQQVLFSVLWRNQLAVATAILRG